MVSKVTRLTPMTEPDGLAERFAQVRARLGVPSDFPPEVLAAAKAAAEEPRQPGPDLLHVPFATVDPPGSTDLDQAMALSRNPRGYRVEYAIADVPAFVDPAGPVAAEALRRGQTVYSPDLRTPLHPQVLSEDAASLLPDAVRPAFVWRFDLDDTGRVTATDLVRALVRSRQRLDYAGVQAAADAAPEGSAAAAGAERDSLPVLLREIGLRRLALERERGGASLSVPDQEVVQLDGGGYAVRLRPPVPAEDWNAQLSLMTGMAAAELMLTGGVGVLRTMPPPDAGALGRFRLRAAALGVEWPQELPYGELLRSLDPAVPGQLALLHAAGSLFRGAGYHPFDAAAARPAPVGAEGGHAAVAAPYAHVTAPLRRLVDRFGLVICHAVRTGAAVPGWARDGLAALPAAMAASDQLAGEVERGCLDLVEAAVLAGRVGEQFDAVAITATAGGSAGPGRSAGPGGSAGSGGPAGKVQVLDPPVLARCTGLLTPGTAVRVRLAVAEPATGEVTFEALPAGSAAAAASAAATPGR